MAKFKPYTDPDTGLKGWQIRFTNPFTGIRQHETFRSMKKPEAMQAFGMLYHSLELQKYGIEDKRGFATPYTNLVLLFLEKAPIGSDARRERLRTVLEANPLRIQAAADLFNLGKLTARLLEYERASGCTRHFSIHSIQMPLKQLAKWARGSLLPVNPLTDWEYLPVRAKRKKRRAFPPEMMRGILECAAYLDQVLRRKFGVELCYRAFLLTGNRPGAMIASNYEDLVGGRIALPPGKGNKHNGAATLPPEFIAELKAAHHDPKPKSPLFRSANGKRRVDRNNLPRDFRRAMALWYVRQHPQRDFADIPAEEISHTLATGRAPLPSGRRSSDPVKNAAILAHADRIMEAANLLRPGWTLFRRGRDMYALRKTHNTWSDLMGVRQIDRRVQTGHAAVDVDDVHYNDDEFANPFQSSRAVWDVLTGKRHLPKRESEPAALPTVAEVNGGDIVVGSDGNQMAMGSRIEATHETDNRTTRFAAGGKTIIQGQSEIGASNLTHSGVSLPTERDQPRQRSTPRDITRDAQSTTYSSEKSAPLADAPKNCQPDGNSPDQVRLVCHLPELIRTLSHLGCWIHLATPQFLHGETIMGDFYFVKCPTNEWRLDVPFTSNFPYSLLEILAAMKPAADPALPASPGGLAAPAPVRDAVVPPDFADPGLQQIANAWQFMTPARRQKFLSMLGGSR